MKNLKIKVDKMLKDIEKRDIELNKKLNDIRQGQNLEKYGLNGLNYINNARKKLGI